MHDCQDNCTLSQIFTLASPFLLAKNGDLPPEAASEPGFILANQLNESGLTECLNQLKRCPAGLDPALARCVSFGVAFHHAG